MKRQKITEGSPPIFYYPSIQEAGRKLLESDNRPGFEKSKDSDKSGYCPGELKENRNKKEMNGILRIFVNFIFHHEQYHDVEFYDYKSLQKVRQEYEANRPWSNHLMV